MSSLTEAAAELPAFTRDSDTVGYDRLARHLLRALGQMGTLPAGGGVATMAGTTWHMAVSRQNRSLPWSLNLYF